MGQYQTDLAQCEQIAQQEAIAGAGVVVGGARGGDATSRKKARVVGNCLRQRGYKVLNQTDYVHAFCPGRGIPFDSESLQPADTLGGDSRPGPCCAIFQV